MRGWYLKSNFCENFKEKDTIRDGGTWGTEGAEGAEGTEGAEGAEGVEGAEEAEGAEMAVGAWTVAGMPLYVLSYG